MNNLIFFLVLVLSLAKYSIQDCCYVAQIKGDGQTSYYLDVILKPPANEVKINYYDPYTIFQVDSYCQANEGGVDTSGGVVCQNSGHPGYFQTRVIMKDPNNAFNGVINLDVNADGMRCNRSYDSCNANGSVSTQNANDYCLGFLGCYPKMACYIALAVFVVCIAGIVLAIIRRNSGSGEKAALDRPNTKREHLNDRPDPINYNTPTTNSKETLIQIDDMPLDFKEAGTTNWVNQKYGSPGKDLGLGLGSGSGGFGSRNSLLPTSNVTVINDPSAGLNRGRSVKRTQSTKSTKKPRTNDPNHLNAPPLPNSSPLYSTSSLNRNKSTRSVKSVKSVKSTKSVRKPRPAEGSSSLNPKKSLRKQPSQKRYQIPSDSESDSDSDNEVLGLRAKQPSMKRVHNSSGSLPRKTHHTTSVKGKKVKYTSPRY